MEDSDELFDYIADLPSDNVLEICNFVLIGGGGGGGGGGVGGGNGVVNDGRVAADHDMDSNTANHYNNNFVEILDFQVEPSNNNNNDRIMENTLNEGQEKVKNNSSNRIYFISWSDPGEKGASPLYAANTDPDIGEG